MRKFLAVAGAVLFFAAAPAAHATHYLLGYSSVDSGEIRWGGSTQYSSAWSNAISVWNALGSVNIAPDTPSTYQDLTVSDVNISAVGWWGAYDHQIGSDSVMLNVYHMSGGNITNHKHITLHELGHALGLADSYPSNAMDEDEHGAITLGSQDITDYQYLY